MRRRYEVVVDGKKGVRIREKWHGEWLEWVRLDEEGDDFADIEARLAGYMNLQRTYRRGGAR